MRPARLFWRSRIRRQREASDALMQFLKKRATANQSEASQPSLWTSTALTRVAPRAPGAAVARDCTAKRKRRSHRTRAGVNDRSDVLAAQCGSEPARHEPLYYLNASKV